MGILDSILGTQSAANTTAAANQANGMLTNAWGDENNTLRGLNVDAQGNVNQATNTARQDLLVNNSEGRNDLSNAAGQAQGYLSTAAGNYSPYMASGQGALSMYGNALGLNGAAGNAAATAAFQAAPGYQYSIDQATNQAQRAAAAAGMNASGNTLQAVTTLGQNLANQGYNQWLSNLSGLSGQGLTAASGQANVLGNQAGVAQNLGTQQNQSLDALSTGLASQAQNQGTTNAALDANLGNSLAGNETALSQAWGKNAITAGNAQDTAQNANNKIISGDIGSVLGKVTAPGGLFASILG